MRKQHFNTKHGFFGTKIYNTWAQMLGRCRNPKNGNYIRYGGRGIKVCERWIKFENFYADMGDCPGGKTLDRIDNDGDYTKTNCKWSTALEQSNNQRRTFKVMYKGKERNLLELSEISGINGDTIYARIRRCNWPVEKAVERPVCRGK